MPLLLVIDDDPLTLECFGLLFAKEEAVVATATTAAEGLKHFSEKRPAVVILDIRLPDQSGLELFRRLQHLNAKVPIIFMTGHGTAGTAIEAMKLGAYDYVVKPLDPHALRQMIQRAMEISRLMLVPAKVGNVDAGCDTAEDILIGKCPEMQEVYKAIGRVAPQNVTVLILGESGTGKELVARAIYHYSIRLNRPFLAINCAAIPETLLESELFGHEKGSFTGADHKRIGKFEQCSGGTLFLDEIGDMTPLTQTKILRVLQDGQFERVGGNETIKADVRIIAATNRNLSKLIEQGRFRQDLYYRLNVYNISLPPLRERADDLCLLAQHFVRRISRELSKEVEGVCPEALEMLQRHPWPGNVRELQSVLKQAILQATGPVLVPECLPPLVRPTKTETGLVMPIAAPEIEAHLTRFIEDRLHAGTTNLREEVLELVERHLILQVLRHTESNQSQAALILGMTRKTLRAMLTSRGICIERATTVQKKSLG
jgi:two-component system nitrogen regulation response regulator GlnG